MPASLKAEDDPLYALAADLSKGDATILDKVRGFIENPPTTTETIGFYGADDDDPQTRAFLATVSFLADQDMLYSIEDKYLPEILSLWIDDGHLQLDELPEQAQAVFGPIIEDGFDALPGGRDAALAAFAELLNLNYAVATTQLERQFADKSNALISIDATEGDTMFFALVPEKIAAKWRNVSFAGTGDYQCGVRDPMWDRFWSHLVYALGLPTVGETYTRPLPPGTRERVDFAK